MKRINNLGKETQINKNKKSKMNDTSIDILPSPEDDYSTEGETENNSDYSIESEAENNPIEEEVNIAPPTSFSSDKNKPKITSTEGRRKNKFISYCYTRDILSKACHTICTAITHQNKGYGNTILKKDIARALNIRFKYLSNSINKSNHTVITREFAKSLHDIVTTGVYKLNLEGHSDVQNAVSTLKGYIDEEAYSKEEIRDSFQQICKELKDHFKMKKNLVIIGEALKITRKKLDKKLCTCEITVEDAGYLVAFSTKGKYSLMDNPKEEIRKALNILTKYANSNSEKSHTPDYDATEDSNTIASVATESTEKPTITSSITKAICFFKPSSASSNKSTSSETQELVQKLRDEIKSQSEVILKQQKEIEQLRAEKADLLYRNSPSY